MTESRRVLVIDDVRAIRDLVQMVGESDGLEVTTAQNGADALEKIPSVRPDVILLDIEMPIMDGLEFMEQYRGLAEATARVVVFTAAAEISDYSAQIGADSYLAKPFAIQDLIRAMG